MTGNGHNTQEELASYAMQGLPHEESASIRAHLQSCLPAGQSWPKYVAISRCWGLRFHCSRCRKARGNAS